MDICGNICGKISAINLKEVNVTFNKAVDKDSAENEKNYSVNEGLVIDSAALADDDKTVTLTLTSKMTNQKEYKLSVRNIAD
ncbi:Ig-like domain-containing protein, partial [Clostridium sp.]|uniref:Ig-like domain-containing protein n=1 Tax=Clostridium sp. TaxID=1506 RepID=UPI0035A12324